MKTLMYEFEMCSIFFNKNIVFDPVISVSLDK